MKKEWIGKNISSELENMISERKNAVINRQEGKYVKLTPEDTENDADEVIWPIISEGDAIGAVVLLGKNGKHMGEAEKILAKCASGFMGRQMEA